MNANTHLLAGVACFGNNSLMKTGEEKLQRLGDAL